MCGLGGIISKSTKHNARFLHLAYMNTERGGDSFGVTGMNPATNEVKIFKRQGLVHDSIHKCRFISTMPTLLLHTRQSTHGSPANMINNHPFSAGSIIGSHNGVISNYQELGAGYPIQSECDSECLIHMINDFRDDTDIQDFISNVRGYYVVNWIDKRNTGVVNILRGGASTMISMFEIKGVGIVYSSDEYHIPCFASDTARKINIPQYSLTTIDTRKLKVLTREFKAPKLVYAVAKYNKYEYYDYDYETRNDTSLVVDVPSYYDGNDNCYKTYDGIPIEKSKTLDGKLSTATAGDLQIREYEKPLTVRPAKASNSRRDRKREKAF